MKEQAITLAYLKMTFSTLLNDNKAVTIATLNGKPMPFEEWVKEVYEEGQDWWVDLKELGIEEVTITYQSGLELTFKL